MKTEDVKKEEVKKEISDDDGNTTPGLSSVVVDVTANDYLNAAVSKSAVQKAAVVKAGAIDVKAAGLPTETSMIGPPKPPAKPPPLHLVVAAKLLARNKKLRLKVAKGPIKGSVGDINEEEVVETSTNQSVPTPPAPKKVKVAPFHNPAALPPSPLPQGTAASSSTSNPAEDTTTPKKQRPFCRPPQGQPVQAKFEIGSTAGQSVHAKFEIGSTAKAPPYECVPRPQMSKAPCAKAPPLDCVPQPRFGCKPGRDSAAKPPTPMPVKEKPKHDSAAGQPTPPKALKVEPEHDSAAEQPTVKREPKNDSAAKLPPPPMPGKAGPRHDSAAAAPAHIPDAHPPPPPPPPPPMPVKVQPTHDSAALPLPPPPPPKPVKHSTATNSWVAPPPAPPKPVPAWKGKAKGQEGAMPKGYGLSRSQRRLKNKDNESKTEAQKAGITDCLARKSLRNSMHKVNASLGQRSAELRASSESMGAFEAVKSRLHSAGPALGNNSV